MDRSSISPAYRVPILAVDDTPANLLALQALTDHLDIDLITAASGAEAIEHSTRREYALILLDVMMPGIDGLETLKQLRALPSARTTPVIFLTARDLNRSMMSRAYALGAVDYLTKPFDTEALLAKLAAFIALYQKEQEIRRQANALAAKDQHIAVLAHDLRTPLSVIAMGARLLQDEEHPQVRGIATRIDRAVNRMQELTSDVLSLAQAADRKLEPVLEYGDLAVLCTEFVDDFQATYPNVRFERRIQAAANCSFDPRRMQQAIGNLLSNAVKFGDGWVSLALTAAADFVTVEIANGGTPIPAERLPSLFKRFERASDTQPGTGLGLYIVRSIARAHGGDVTVTSNSDCTAFSLRLPR